MARARRSDWGAQESWKEAEYGRMAGSQWRVGMVEAGGRAL